MITSNHSILFQGDSITDAGRDRSRSVPNDSGAMGSGYAYLAMSRLLTDRPRAKPHGTSTGALAATVVPDLRALVSWTA